MATDELPRLVRKSRLVITDDDIGAGGVPQAPPSPPGPPAPALGGDALPSLPPAPVYSGGEREHPSYTVCTVREVLDGQFSSEDSLIFPVPGPEIDSVVMEDRDGQNICRVFCNEIEVLGGDKNERLMRAADIRAQVLITDARLTVACSKFDRGKTLVGQIRYPWIRGVYAQNKGGWLGSEMVRIIVKSGGESMRLELTFPKDVDATAIGTELIRRAAEFRLRFEPGLDQADHAKLTDLARVEPLVWRKGDSQMAGRQFPSYWPGGVRSARFGLIPGSY
jgi:hypothetical protein